MYELIIVGGGPAGLTAAVYAARKQINTLLLTKEFGGQPMWTSGVENYMGFQFVTGPELMAKFEEQIHQFPIESKYEEVINVEKSKDGSFTVRTVNGEYQGETVIIASGKRPRKLNVPGEERLLGRGVAFCATCDGPFYKGKRVAVVGGGNSGVQAVIELSRIATEVHAITNNEFIADPVLLEKFEKLTNVVTHTKSNVIEIIGTDAVEQILIQNIETNDKISVPIDGIFVEIGLDPNSQMLASLLELNRRGEIPVELNTETKIPGLFAAGDVTSVEENQIIIAAGEGSKAALKAFEYLLRKK